MNERAVTLPIANNLFFPAVEELEYDASFSRRFLARRARPTVATACSW